MFFVSILKSLVVSFDCIFWFILLTFRYSHIVRCIMQIILLLTCVFLFVHLQHTYKRPFFVLLCRYFITYVHRYSYTCTIGNVKCKGTSYIVSKKKLKKDLSLAFLTFFF